MAIFKIKHEKRGGHIHCALFAAKQKNMTWAKCGEFVVRDDEFEDLQYVMAGVTFENIGRDPDAPLKLTPLHIKLLQRGARGQYIGLSDDMGFRMGEIDALGELHRAGYAEDAKGPFPPGPPSLTPSVITEAGRRALKAADPGRPVPHHGSGPDNQ